MPILELILKTKPKKAQEGMVLDPDKQREKSWRITEYQSMPQTAYTGNLKMPTFSSKVGTTNLAPGPSQTKTRVSGSGPSMSGIAGAISQTHELAGDLVENFSKPAETNIWGITKENYKANTASGTIKSAGTMAASGASFGFSVGGPWGAAIGGAVGLIGGTISGLLKGKKAEREGKKEYKDSTQAAYEAYNQKANAAQYAALAKYGAKLSIIKDVKNTKHNAISYKGHKFKPGGKLSKVGEVNIIPSGTLHKENNNLGQKDKGIPIINDQGKKEFEVEREELILRLKTTKEVESLVEKYNKSNNEKHLVDLGKLLSKEIITNTQDLSGKYNLEVKQ